MVNILCWRVYILCWTVYSLCWTVYSLRWTVYSLRCTVCVGTVTHFVEVYILCVVNTLCWTYTLRWTVYSLCWTVVGLRCDGTFYAVRDSVILSNLPFMTGLLAIEQMQACRKRRKGSNKSHYFQCNTSLANQRRILKLLLSIAEMDISNKSGAEGVNYFQWCLNRCRHR